MGRDFRFYGERPVRDSALILKVDDLINIATGNKDKNVVDLKMLQFILYILAGHVSILEQMVELRIPKDGETLTMEDEYYDDIKRRDGAQKPFVKDKKIIGTGGKQGADKIKITPDKNKYIDNEKVQGRSKDDHYDRERPRGDKRGVKDDDEGKGKRGQEDRSRGRVKEEREMKRESKYRGRRRGDENISAEDYDSEDRESGKKEKESEDKRDRDNERQAKDRVEKFRDGKGRGREGSKKDIDKYREDKGRGTKSSDSDEEYRREARGKQGRDERRMRKYSEDTGSGRDSGRRARSLDLEGTGGRKRRSRDEGFDRDDQIKHGSLDRTTKAQGIQMKMGRQDKNKIHEKFSDTRDESAKKSQGTSVGNDVGSFLVQVKQRTMSPRRGGETSRVKGDKSGKHRQYDADSAGGAGRDDRYQGRSGGRGTNLDDGRGGSERGEGGRSWGGGGGGGGGRDWDDGANRRRRKCDTGRRRKGAKTDEEDVDDEEALKILRERNESLEAGGLWQCTGRQKQESFEETEGILVADSKGNMRFVPLDDSKGRGRDGRDERSYKDRGKEGRDYDRNRKGKDYDRDYHKGKDDRGYDRYGKGKDYDRDYDREFRGDRTEDDDGRGGRRGRDDSRERWYDRDGERDGEGEDGRKDQYRDISGRVGWDSDQDRVGRESGRDRGTSGWDMEDDGEGRDGRSGRKGERYGRRRKDDKERDGRYGRERARDDEDFTDKGDTDKRRAERGDRDGQGGFGFAEDEESDKDKAGARRGERADREGSGGKDHGSSRGEKGEEWGVSKRYRDREDMDADNESSKARRDRGIDDKGSTKSDDYERKEGEESSKSRGPRYEESGKGRRYRTDDDRDGRYDDEDEKRGRRKAKTSRERGDRQEDESRLSGGSEDEGRSSKDGRDDGRDGVRYDGRDGKGGGRKGKYDEYGSGTRKTDGDESISGDDEDGRKRVDREYEDGYSEDEEDGKRGKGRKKGGEIHSRRGKTGDRRSSRGRGKDEGIGSDGEEAASIKGGKRGKVGRGKEEKDVEGGRESDEDEHGGRKRRSDYEVEGNEGRGTGRPVGESDEDDNIDIRKGAKRGSTGDDEDLGKDSKGIMGHLGDSDEGDSKDGMARQRADDDKGVGKKGRGKKEEDESDEGGAIGRKYRTKTGKEKGYSDDDTDLDADKGGKGKGKGRDIEEGRVRGDKWGENGDKDRRGRDKDAVSKAENDTKGRDIESRDTESLTSKDEKHRGLKQGKEGERDADERGRRGKDKDAESVSSKGGKDKYGTDAGGKDSERLSVKGGKGRRDGKGGDGYDDEDDTRGQDGAVKGTGRGKAGDKVAAGQRDKGLKGRDTSLTSVATGASVGRGGKGAGRKSGAVSREGSTPRVGSIEVVTRTQFQLLEKAVEELQKKAGPMAQPIMPDNKQLLTDISRGNASLTDVIQALQLQARLQAAEHAIDRMTDLIAQLAAAGALTPEMLAKVADIRTEVAEGYKDVALGPGGKAEQEKQLRKRITDGSRASTVTAGTLGTIGTTGTGGSGVGRRVSVPQSPLMKPSGARPSKLPGMMLERFARLPMVTGSGISAEGRSLRSAKTLGSEDCITAQELDDALKAMREEFERMIAAMTTRANNSAEHAAQTAKTVADKLDTAMQLTGRLSTLYNMVDDYTEQLNGFDAGVSTQIEGFQQQMSEIKNDLKDGLDQLLNVNNNAETAAVIELSERYEGLVADLDVTLHNHQNMNTQQSQLSDELRSLLECVEMLRESKADRDEVLDGLRDKADISRLEGLLTEDAFACARADLELRMRMCYDKFRAQDQVWLGAVKDFSNVISNKAEVMQLMGTRDDMQEQLHQLNRKCMQLTKLMGDPKAAVLARKLAKDGTCAACKVPALMEPTDISTVAPPALPALRKKRPEPAAVAGADSDVCLKDVSRIHGHIPTTDFPPPSDVDDEKDVHICKRWVGGSHTLVTSQVTRERAPPLQVRTLPMRRYVGPGTDGKLYMLAEACIPCEECNTLYTQKIPGEIEVPQAGVSSAASDITVVTGTEARRVTIISEKDLPTQVKVEDKEVRRTSLTERQPSTVERRSIVAEPRPAMIGKRLSMAERPSLIEKQFSLAEKGSSGEKRLSRVEKRLTEKSSVGRTSDGSERTLVEYKLKGSKTSLTGFEEQIPRKLSDIGVIMRGRVTLVDEEAARRAEIRYEAARLEALQSTTDHEDPEDPEKKETKH